jgi:hypothetical protein
MNSRTIGVVAIGVCLALTVGGKVTQAEPGCKIVSGKILEVQIPAPNDIPPGAFGRVLGSVTGSLNGSKTAILRTPPALGIPITTQDIFVTTEGDLLVTNGVAIFTGVAPGTVSDVLTLTVDGAASAGQFAGATGTIVVTGLGFNLGSGPGTTFFELEYRGQICQP